MRKFRAVDLFCGGGGTSYGAEETGSATVEFAVNHWDIAIQTHSANFPHCRHVCQRIDQVNPGEVDRCDLLFASPECTHHSRARGGRPMVDQKRAMAWDVLKWVDFHRPQYLVIENVVEFEEWGPLSLSGRPLVSKRGKAFEAWVQAIRSFNYRVEWRRLNAADFGAATSRTRLFVIARKGNRRIEWPEPTHCEDPRGQFPGMRLQPWVPAWQVIDWQIPCPSIFSRKRPLADKTLLRIEAGLRRFCRADNLEAFLVKLRGTCTAASAAEPVPTVTAGGNHEALAVPFMVPRHGERDGQEPRTHSTGDPLPTITTENAPCVAMPLPRQGFYDSRSLKRCRGVDEPFPTLVGHPNAGGHLIMPWVMSHCSEGAPRSIDSPIPTMTTTSKPWLAVPYMVDVNHGDARHSNGRSQNVNSPLGTVTAHNGRALCLPMITKFYGTGIAHHAGEPLDTVTTKDRHGVAMVRLIETMRELNIVDIGFRMLSNAELARATGFPETYHFAGNKSEITKQIGNAVCPDVAFHLTKACAAA